MSIYHTFIFILTETEGKEKEILVFRFYVNNYNKHFSKKHKIYCNVFHICELI